MRHLFISFGVAACLNGAFAGEPRPADEKAVTQIESGPLYLGSINSGFKVSEDYIDANLNLVAPVWSSLGSHDQLGGGIIFLEPYVSWGEKGEVATSLGLGYRYLFNDQPVSALRSPREDQAGFWDEGLAIGANLFVDLLDTEADNRFWQLGFGLEVATRYIELRGNYYLPLTDKQLAERRTFTERQTQTRTTTRPVTETSAPYDDGQGFLVQDQTTSLVSTTTTTTTLIRHIFERYEEGMEGWDAEVALLVPGIDKWCDVKLLGGYFQLDNAPFGPQEGGTGNVEGWKAGIEVRPIPAVAVTAMWYEDERFLGSEWVLGARMEIPFESGDLGDGKGMWGRIRDAFKPRRRHLVERLAEPVRRQNAAIHIANTKKQESKVSKQSTSSNTKVISQTKTKIVLGLGPSATEFTPTADGTLTLGGLTFNGATVQWQSTNLVGTLYTNRIGSSIFVPAGGGSAMYLPAGSIASGGIGAAVTFSASNTYSASSSISMGTLRLSPGGGGATMGLSAGATLDLSAARGTAILAGNNTIFANTTLTINGTNTAGLSALSKLGSGAFVLTGSNTYAGSTTVSAGTIIAADGALNGAAITNLNSNLLLSSGGLTIHGSSTSIAGGRTLTVGNTFSGTTQLPTNIGNTSNFIVQNSNLRINGTEITPGTYAISNGAINVNGGTVQLSGATITAIRSGSTTSGGSVVNLGAVNSSGAGAMLNLTSAGAFVTTNGNTVNLAQATGGMLTLTGASSYTGPITVSSGSFNFSPGGVSATSLVLPRDAVINGTTVSAGTYQITNGSIFVNGASLPLPNATITVPTTP